MANRSQSRSTTDHDEIRQCAEARGGRPAVVKSTRGNGMIPEFCGSIFLATAPVRSRKSRGKNSSKKLDREKLALVYQDTATRGAEE